MLLYRFVITFFYIISLLQKTINISISEARSIYYTSASFFFIVFSDEFLFKVPASILILFCRRRAHLLFFFDIKDRTSQISACLLLRHRYIGILLINFTDFV